MNQSWIFLFIILLLVLIFIVSSKSKNQKEILPITYIQETVTPRLIQNENDPVVQKNLTLIESANDMEQKKKLAGAPTICVFKPNKFITYSYDQFIATFTGLILPSALGPTRANTPAVKYLNPYEPRTLAYQGFDPDHTDDFLHIQQRDIDSIMRIQTETGRPLDFSKIPPVEPDKSVFYGVSPKLFNKARDQGACGSCWAYSAVTAIEAQVVKKFLIENPAYLSIQYYIDCVKQCRGCEGGFPIYVYEQVAKDGFVVWDAYAPYLGQETQVCQPPKEKFPFQLQGMIVFSKNDASYFTAQEVEKAFTYQNLELDIPNNDTINKIKKILFNYGPVSALIYVDDKLPYFSNGIYKTIDNKDGVKQNPNHAIVIGGYGINVYGERYWIIRNSWGSEWGEDGYVPLSMDSAIAGIDIPVFDNIPPTL